MQHNPATHGVQVPGSTVKSCLTVQHSKRKSQRFMHSEYGFPRVFLSHDLKRDEPSGDCRAADGALSLQALLVCRPPDLSYLRNWNTLITCWQTRTPMVRLTQLAAATKVTPSESVEQVRNAEGRAADVAWSKSPPRFPCGRYATPQARCRSPCRPERRSGFCP
jgi:hypothetical protein